MQLEIKDAYKRPPTKVDCLGFRWYRADQLTTFLPFPPLSSNFDSVLKNVLLSKDLLLFLSAAHTCLKHGTFEAYLSNGKFELWYNLNTYAAYFGHTTIKISRYSNMLQIC